VLGVPVVGRVSAGAVHDRLGVTSGSRHLCGAGAGDGADIVLPRLTRGLQFGDLTGRLYVDVVGPSWLVESVSVCVWSCSSRMSACSCLLGIVSLGRSWVDSRVRGPKGALWASMVRAGALLLPPRCAVSATCCRGVFLLSVVRAGVPGLLWNRAVVG